MTKYRMLIDGQLVEGDSTIDIVNPADESVVAQCPVANETQLEQAVKAAKQAFVSWRNTPLAERAELVNKMIATIKEHQDELAEIITLEQGKPLARSQDEVMFSQLFADHFANQEIKTEVLIDDENQRVEIHRKPLGVVAGICPWNFPLLISVYKIAPAIMTGNTVIIKPAPSTPLSSLRLGELIQNVFPAGVVNIISDNNALGPVISSHPDIAKVSFTGSTPTGKKIMASAAGTLKRLTLELGGNDAAVVLDDADVKKAAVEIFGSTFINSGQVCIALKRLYVHDSIYDEMCKEIASLANSAKVGNGLNEEVEFGPVQNKMQFDKVCTLIELAKADGKVIAGGQIPNTAGFNVPLTVVRDIDDSAALVCEEQFGPVLPIVRYSDLDDVIERVNNSPFGLGGSVWSSNLERAQQVAERIDSGTVWINQHTVFGPHIPFAPAKESGLGVEWGKEGLLEYTAMQVINISKL